MYVQKNKNSIILCNSANVFHTSLPPYGTQTTNPFLSSMILANCDKGDGFQQIRKSLYSSLFLYSKNLLLNQKKY